MRLLLAALVLSLPAAALAEAAPPAKALYARRCAGCHGADGRADTKPGKKYKMANLAGPAWPRAWSREKIRAVIAEGVPGQMPAWREKLSDAEIDALAGYVLTLSAAK